MKRLQQILCAAALAVAGLSAVPAQACNQPMLPNWYGFIGGPRVCDDVNADGWCVSWHWEVKESAKQRAQRLKSHRRGQMERLRVQDGELNFRPAEPKMITVNGDSVTEEPTGSGWGAQ